MQRLVEEKNVVVTGANRGIGKEIVKTLAKNGANIFACARKKNLEFEKEMESLSLEHKVNVYPIYFDLQDSVQMKEAVKEIRKSGKKIDGLVNNAGVLSEYKLFSMITMEEIRKVFDIDFFAQVEFTQYITRLMKRNGSIIYISSIAGMDGFFSSYDYVSCKAAINGAMKQQARELGRLNIRVNSVAPGIVETDMIKDSNKENLEKIIPAIMLGRFGTKEEVANTVLFLTSDLSSYITGQTLRVDGGTNPPRATW